MLSVLDYHFNPTTFHLREVNLKQCTTKVLNSSKQTSGKMLCEREIERERDLESDGASQGIKVFEQLSNSELIPWILVLLSQGGVGGESIDNGGATL